MLKIPWQKIGGGQVSPPVYGDAPVHNLLLKLKLEGIVPPTADVSFFYGMRFGLAQMQIELNDGLPLCQTFLDGYYFGAGMNEALFDKMQNLIQQLRFPS